MAVKIVYRDESYQIRFDGEDYAVERVNTLQAFANKNEALSYVKKLTEVPDNSVEGWHFVDKSRILTYGDNRVIKAGETVHVDPPIVPMKHGLLISRKPITALKYGRRPVACHVRGFGTVVSHGDEQYAVSDRMCLWIGDAMTTVVNWAGWCVMRAIELQESQGNPVDPIFIRAARMALDFYPGSQIDMQEFMTISTAMFSIPFNSPVTISSVSRAASLCSQAVQTASTMSGFGQFPSSFPGAQFPQFPGNQFPQQFPQFPSAQPQVPSFGSMDFTMTNSDSAAETAAKAFPSFDEEREIQNVELERRLLLLEAA